MWFIPNSTLTTDQLKKIPTEVATRTPAALERVAGIFGGFSISDPSPIEAMDTTLTVSKSAGQLAELFAKYGSDKSTTHNYHLIYGYIFSKLAKPLNLLEIGLGSNNVGIPSNMGSTGTPGASLRAFRDFLPESGVFGADIDPSISVEGCQTFVVDQLNPASFNPISHSGLRFELIIDDGLHSPDANLNTLAFALGCIATPGYIVIEDIPESALPLWRLVQRLALSTMYRTRIYKARRSYAFVLTTSAELPGL